MVIGALPEIPRQSSAQGGREDFCHKELSTLEKMFSVSEGVNVT